MRDLVKVNNSWLPGMALWKWLLNVFLRFHIKIRLTDFSQNCRPPTYHASGFFVACLIVKATAPTQPVPMMTNRGASCKGNGSNNINCCKLIT